jgi:hypothetical protein
MTATVIFLLQTLVSTLLRPLVADWPLLLRSAVTIAGRPTRRSRRATPDTMRRWIGGTCTA